MTKETISQTRTLHHKGERLPSGELLDERVAEEIFKTVEERYGNMDYFIGKGQIAEVYYYPVKGICAKVIVEKDVIENGRVKNISGPKHPSLPLQQEAVLLDRAHNIDGVTAPLPYATQKTMILRDFENGKKERVTVQIMLQQLVRGVSVRDIDDGKAHLPERFDLISFLDNLKSQILSLNKVYQ